MTLKMFQRLNQKKKDRRNSTKPLASTKGTKPTTVNKYLVKMFSFWFIVTHTQKMQELKKRN